MDQPNPIPTERLCSSCKRLCPASHYHRMAVECKTCIYEKLRKSYLKKHKALKPMPARRELSIIFNLNQYNKSILTHLLSQISTVGNHLQSLYCFKVNTWESRIVQLSVGPNSFRLIVYLPGSSKVQFENLWTTDNYEIFLDQCLQTLRENHLRLAKDELDVATSVHALKNEW